MKYHVYLTPPLNFQTTVEVAGLFCEHQEKLLFLKRQPHKSEGNTWSIPAGKLESGENPVAAVIREIYEEIGITIEKHNLEEVGKVYIRLPTIDLIFHMFHKSFHQIPEIALNLEENQETQWSTLDEAMKLPLISAGREVLAFYRSYLSKKGN